MARPTFLTDGNTPRRSDSQWFVIAKWLGKVQDNLGGAALSANDPDRRDTKRTLLQKIDAAKSGVAYHG